MHPLPGSIRRPLAEVVIDDQPGRPVMGEHAPGAATAEEIEDGVQDLTCRVGGRSAAWLGCADQRLNQGHALSLRSGG